MIITQEIEDDFYQRIKLATLEKFNFNRIKLDGEIDDDFVNRMIFLTISQWVLDIERLAPLQQAQDAIKVLQDDVNAIVTTKFQPIKGVKDIASSNPA